MFTGLVEAIGEVFAVEEIPHGKRLVIAATFSSELKMGESVAVNGVCLTVHAFDATTFQADVIPETIDRTVLASLTPKTSVHLERALRASDRLGGHFVQGHVDGVATLKKNQTDDQGIRWTLKPQEVSLMKYIALKGSITLHGVSLTVTAITPETFEVALVPHTLEKTIFLSFKEGDRLHLEVDVLARTLEQLLRNLNMSRS
jgi:riboflavin synthase